MDVVWLKRDFRIHDHGPFAEICRSDRPFVVLYLYEPDQLSEPSVHGSHIHFINESLAELDRKLSASHEVDKRIDAKDKSQDGLLNNTCKQREQAEECENTGFTSRETYQHYLRAITVLYSESVSAFEAIHLQRPINRILSHEETGHLASFARDKRVRKWCKTRNVSFLEYNQTGVTRGLKDRDLFSKNFNSFVRISQYSSGKIDSSWNRLIRNLNLSGSCTKLMRPEDLKEIPVEYQTDRVERQRGGEEKGLDILKDFLSKRVEGYSKGISSPNSSWSSCSRLSPYLSWGNVSVRHVIQSVRQRQTELKNLAKGLSSGDWGRSMAAFLSRMHWRSHFMQKLESECSMEKQDICPAFQSMRRQPGDWNQNYYEAWAMGRTGFPFVDACMRCLLHHGWLNFRMRSMLVTFACYNLWLDWKRIAPHLARVFLDFEPGIHYPQLQMQAGTTGINAMRVYSVTKQGKDQDPNGDFIRKYVKELSLVPKPYIHEPWLMKEELQRKYKVVLLPGERIGSNDINCYPLPIVNEKESSKLSKSKMSQIRKLDSTQEMARKVYMKHGSRSNRSSDSNERARKIAKTASSPKFLPISIYLNVATSSSPHEVSLSGHEKNELSESQIGSEPQIELEIEPVVFDLESESDATLAATTQDVRTEENRKRSMDITRFVLSRYSMKPSVIDSNRKSMHSTMEPCTNSGSAQGYFSDFGWQCQACTFWNAKPHAPVCEICGRQKAAPSAPFPKI